MHVTTEIKNKEDSLSALMSRVLREPLDPLIKSINASMEALLETKDKLDDIELRISDNGNHVEEIIKPLKRAINGIKDEVLPDHAQSIQRQLKTLSESNSKKIQDYIDAQQQSIYILKTNHDTVLGEIRANQALNKRAIAELIQECTASTQTLAAGLQNATRLIENAIVTQQRALEASHQTLLEQFSSAANDRNTIQQSLTHLVAQHEGSKKSLVKLNESSSFVYARLADVEQTSASVMKENQTALTRMLTEQNSVFTAHIAAAQAKLKTLTITTGVFFVSMLGYVGYDVWSKFN